MTYTIRFLRSFNKDIRRIPSMMIERIKNSIESLRTNPMPEGCKPIRGYEGHYRIRVGQYRIVYEIASTIRIITIVKVGHRKDVYRNL